MLGRLENRVALAAIDSALPPRDSAYHASGTAAAGLQALVPPGIGPVSGMIRERGSTAGQRVDVKPAARSSTGSALTASGRTCL